MSEARKFKVETRLSTHAFRPGGMTVADALRRADAALETMRGPCLETIDSAIAEIERRYGAGAAGRADEPFGDLYTLSSRIIDASIFFTGADLDKAARALCQLTALCEAQRAWDWVAIDLHLDALRMLRTVGQAIGERERLDVIKGLNQVTRKRVGDPDALPA
ncbi:MAG: chemotaxis protein CheE [Caulobacteraceae bacterium]|nr:chemotaxis protein CheE [Caulobacteraceae bacterium]